MSANDVRREGLFVRIEGPSENVVWLNILDAREAVRLLEDVPARFPEAAPEQECRHGNIGGCHWCGIPESPTPSASAETRKCGHLRRTLGCPVCRAEVDRELRDGTGEGEPQGIFATPSAPATIIRTTGVCGGRPCVAGTRIEAALLADIHRAGRSVAEMAVDYELTEAQVQAALDYVAGARPEAGKGPYGTSQAEQELPRQRAATVALKAKLDCTPCPCARCTADRAFLRALAKMIPLLVPYGTTDEGRRVTAEVVAAARRVVEGQ